MTDQELEHRKAIINEALHRREELAKHRTSVYEQAQVLADHQEATSLQRRLAHTALLSAMEHYERNAIAVGQWEGEQGIDLSWKGEGE
jgi:hypothetical protein